MAVSAQGQVIDDVEAAVDSMLEKLGKRIVFAMPLGLGKPAELVNALYARACKDASISLKILTALSLEVPKPTQGLEKALLDPLLERVFAGVPELDYMAALRHKTLPTNVEVCEFFFKPGSLIGNAHAQQHYVSSNYTHAARDVFNQGCNVAAQTVCKREVNGETRYSLSCNPDTGPELVELLRAADRPFMAIAQVNQNLPFMVHDAEVDAGQFDLIIDHERYTTPLFSTPKTPVALADYAIGLNASCLLKDGGTLQVGIGALGDAVVQATILRHHHNAEWQRLLDALGTTQHQAELIADCGGLAPFTKGIYGATEMLVDGFMHLYKAGIMKRRVYDFWALQMLVDDVCIDPEQLNASLFDSLDALGVNFLRKQDFDRLQYHGVFVDACRYQHSHVIAPDGSRILANLSDADCRAQLAACLGDKLRNGIVAHGGFFLGPKDFYQALHDLPEERRADFCMTGVDKINQLDRNPRLYKQQRLHARFINTGIMATLSGAVVSDALDNGQVISGVGGQYNFVSMAHQLPTGRSILMIKSLREKHGKLSSNIVSSYGHCTIPRHLRDIIISEYGIAELRSKTDSEVIKALLNITDSRFQQQLLAEAKQAGKLEADYQIPEAYRNNTPEQLAARLAGYEQLLPAFPFGTDLTDMEVVLANALQAVKTKAESTPKWKLLLRLLRSKAAPESALPYLERLQLAQAQGAQNRIARALLIETLQQQGHC